MVPSIWNSANEMYKSAERNWKNHGCVEVIRQVSKTTLQQGEEIVISTESVHLQDEGKANAELTAEAYQGSTAPESQARAPTAHIKKPTIPLFPRLEKAKARGFTKPCAFAFCLSTNRYLVKTNS